MRRNLALLLLLSLLFVPAQITNAQITEDSPWDAIVCGQWEVAPYRWIKFAYFPWDPLNVWDYKGDPFLGGWDISSLDGQFAILFFPWLDEEGNLIGFARMILTDNCTPPPSAPTPIPDEICGVLVKPYLVTPDCELCGGGGLGPVFIPFGKENDPYSWFMLHHFGVFVENEPGWPIEIEYDHPLVLRGVQGYFGDTYITHIRDYELVTSCEQPSPPTSLPPTNTPTVTPQTPYICGYSTNGVLQSGLMGYFYPYIVACPTGEKIAWGHLGDWGMAKYVRINNPVIVNITPVRLNDGTIISKKIESWDDYFEIPDCNVCGQSFLLSTSPSSPPKLAITNIALADTLTQDAFAATHFTTHLLKQNVLWIRVTNTGESPFVAPPGGGQYILQVIVKQPGGKLEEHEFAPNSLVSLEPLASLAPGESQVLTVAPLFFWNQAKNAELEVFLKPDSSLGLPNSIFSKAITIEPHPDSYLECIATVAQTVCKTVEVSTSGKVNCAQAEIAICIGQKMIELDKRNIREAMFCFLDPLLSEYVSKYAGNDIGRLFSLILDAASEVGKQASSCRKVSDFIIASLYQLLLKGYKVGGVITQSPVYPLVANTSGQRTGFLENGQIVQEIPNSRVSQIGETRVILFVGKDVAGVHVTGYSNGAMDLYATLPQDGGGYTLSYEDVQVAEGMRATLNMADRGQRLVVDADGDGEDDLWYAPNEIEKITAKGDLEELSVSQTITPSPEHLTNDLFRFSLPGIRWVLVGLGVVVFVLLYLLWKIRQ